MSGSRESFIQYASVPGAVLADGPLMVPLYAVTALSLTAAYRLPPPGAGGGRQSLDAGHDDTLSLTGLLVGPERFVMKLTLEAMAESAVKGSVLAKLSGGKVGGLVLVTGMTIRTDIYLQSATFSQNAQRRQVIEVSLALVHLPRPGGLPKLLDMASAAAGMMLDPLGAAG